MGSDRPDHLVGVPVSTTSVSEVPQGQRAVAQGSNAKVRVNGDVWGTVIAQGSNATVFIGGYIHAGAQVTAQGSNAKVKYHGKDPGAQVIVQGSNAEEIDMGRGRVIAHPPNQERWIDTALGKKLQIQKSDRLREQWGT